MDSNEQLTCRKSLVRRIPAFGEEKTMNFYMVHLKVNTPNSFLLMVFQRLLEALFGLMNPPHAQGKG